MDDRFTKRKKNMLYQFIIFALFMLGLMINDAIDHPEDFIKGFNSVMIQK